MKKYSFLHLILFISFHNILQEVGVLTERIPHSEDNFMYVFHLHFQYIEIPHIKSMHVIPECHPTRCCGCQSWSH